MKPKKRTIDDEIDRVVRVLENTAVGSPEYTAAVQNLKTLYEARGNKKASVISLDTVVTLLVHALELGLILNQESLHVINWKAIAQLVKVK